MMSSLAACNGKMVQAEQSESNVVSISENGETEQMLLEKGGVTLDNNYQYDVQEISCDNIGGALKLI